MTSIPKAPETRLTFGDDRLEWLQEMARELLEEKRLERCGGCGLDHVAGGQGLAPDLAEFLLQAWNRRRCSPPLPAGEVSRIMADAAAVVLQRLRARAA